MSKATKIRLVCYLVVLAGILAHPFHTIWKYEFSDIPSREFLFECAMRDPYDIMRGRYVQLSFDQENITLPGNRPANYPRGLEVYAVLKEGEDGFAKIVDLVTARNEVPQDGWPLRISSDAVWNTNWQPNDENKGSSYRVRFPFERYYVNEKLAPQAEKVISSALLGNASQKVALKVRILAGGEFAVEDLLVDGRPLREVIAETAE